ncbi:conserved hypothetical protein [Coccidioides posadasii str. Silveira]|uniref:Transcription factor domain-containing protein n=1 Tax=Coccidioides posadasii (strain RMSCC 757 / Silveira) TaxID=443226 RepID=E9DDE9_COCPS|nr:conserved hypothetical protein [Coccidioides posadasii str. Silveira]
MVLLIYALTHNSQRCWVLIGVSHHVAIAIGCHLDPDHFRLGTVEAEKRRRCWAALVILYMRKNVDIRLPVEANDSDLVDDRPVPFPSGPNAYEYSFRLFSSTLPTTSSSGTEPVSIRRNQQCNTSLSNPEDSIRVSCFCTI